MRFESTPSDLRARELVCRHKQHPRPPAMWPQKPESQRSIPSLRALPNWLISFATCPLWSLTRAPCLTEWITTSNRWRSMLTVQLRSLRLLLRTSTRAASGLASSCSFCASWQSSSSLFSKRNRNSFPLALHEISQQHLYRKSAILVLTPQTCHPDNLEVLGSAKSPTYGNG